MKDVVSKDDRLVEAGPDAPKVACPACGGGVELRSRRGKHPDGKTWFYRHQRGEGLDCPRRPGVWG